MSYDSYESCKAIEAFFLRKLRYKNLRVPIQQNKNTNLILVNAIHDNNTRNQMKETVDCLHNFEYDSNIALTRHSEDPSYCIGLTRLIR